MDNLQTERGKRIMVDIAHQYLSDMQKPVTKENLGKAFDGIVHAIREILRQDDIVRIQGIGRFCPATIKGKQAYNFKTKKQMILPDSRRVYFKASESFKDYMKMSDSDYMTYKTELMSKLFDDDDVEVGYVADLLD